MKFGSFVPSILTAGGAGIGFALGGPAGAAIGGGLGGSLGSAYAQDQANQQNIKLAREMFDKQKAETDTAIQRQVADLRAAGLNPVLAAGMGGASSAQAQSAKVEPLSKGVENLAHSALQAMQAQESIVALRKGNIKTDADTVLSGASAKLAEANAQTAAASAEQMRVKTEMMKNNLLNEKERAEFERRQRKIDEDLMYFDNTIKRLDQMGGAVGSALSSIIPGSKAINAFKNAAQGGKYIKVNPKTGEILH